MAQFFNFKEDYFGLTDNEIEKNTKLIQKTIQE